MLLRPSIKNYPWGRVGLDSLVAQLTSKIEPTCNSTPYAELWMGAHPSGPCYLPNGQPLNDYISANPDVLGSQTLSKFGPSLPFLFKVLSVQKALSIQAHPDKSLARILHERDPANYPDDNHKPEMAIAVSPFEVLCGFRTLEEIKQLIRDVPELGALVAGAALESKKDLQEVFTRLMKTDADEIAAKVTTLVARGDSVPEHELISRLHQQFPGDVGVFGVFFLQHILLRPGEAIFLPANEPHAYLDGDCMECMANSDNVVRAGLTPKFKDVDVLTTMLTFDTGKEWTMKAKQIEPGRFLYEPPVDEFAVELFEKSESFHLPTSRSCSVCLVLEGKGRFGANNVALSRGSVMFVPAGDTDMPIEVDEKMVLYRSFVP